MVEQMGEELVQLAEERNERLASDRLVEAIQRMKDVVRGLEQAKNEFEAAERPDKDAEVAFLLVRPVFPNFIFTFHMAKAVHNHCFGFRLFLTVLCVFAEVSKTSILIYRGVGGGRRRKENREENMSRIEWS